MRFMFSHRQVRYGLILFVCMAFLSMAVSVAATDTPPETNTPEPSSTNTPEPPTNTPEPPTATNTPEPPPTGTPLPASSTPSPTSTYWASATPVPSNTPEPPTNTPEPPTNTPDVPPLDTQCPGFTVQVANGSFMSNGDVSFTVQNTSPSTPVSLTDFAINWAGALSKISNLRLVRITVGGQGTNDYPSPTNPNGTGVIIWENLTGGTNISLTLSSDTTAGTWLRPFVFPTGSTTTVYLDFVGVGSQTLADRGVSWSDFDGTELRIVCEEVAIPSSPTPGPTSTPVFETPTTTPTVIVPTVTPTASGTPIVLSQPVITSPLSGGSGILRPIITWNAVAGAAQYEVAVVDLETGIDYAPHATVTTTSFQPIDDLPQRIVTFYVRAINNNLASDWSFLNVYVRLGDSPAYDSTVTTTRPTFTWTALSGVSSYTLQVDNNSDFSSPFVQRNVSGTTYTLTSGEALPNANAYYYWRLKTATLAYPIDGNMFVIGNPYPTAPVISSPQMYSIVGNVRPTFTWAPVSGANHYEIAVIDGDTGLDLGPRDIVTVPQYKPAYNLPQKSIYFYVRAGNGDYWSDWTQLIFAIVLGNSPADGAVIPTTRPTFSWTAVPGASNYTLQVDNDFDFSSPIINRTQTGTSYTLISSEALGNPTGPYYWRVRASNLDYHTGYSYSFSVGTPIPAMPTITSPAYDATVGNLRPTVIWSPVSVATQYEVAFVDPWTGSDLLPRAIVTGTQYKPASNLPQQLIHLYVRAGNAGGWSDWTFSSFMTALGNSPAYGVTVTTTRPTFSWTTVTGATSYTLQVDNDYYFDSPLFTRTTTSTSYTPTSAEALDIPGALYYWRVSASNVDFPPPELNRHIWNGVIPMATNLFTSRVGSTQPTTLFGQGADIVLNWTPPSPAPYEYDVQISLSTDFSTPFTEFTTSDSSVVYSAYNFPAQGAVYWRIRSVFERGHAGVGNWTNSKSFTLDFTPPAVPVLKTPSAGGVISSARPTFTWNASPGATSYELYLYDAQAGAFVTEFPRTVTGTSYTMPSTMEPLYQAPPDNYAWYMVATDAAGNVSGYSPEIHFTVFSGLTPTAGQTLTDTTPRFTWQGVSGTGASPWRLMISSSPDAGPTLYMSPDLPASSTSFTLPNANALPAGTYYWIVTRNNENSVGAQRRELIIAP